MTTFLDGPAKGQTLMLQRAPMFLRAVHGPKGWDALDQLTDRPEPNETLFVYRIEGEPGWCHISRRPRSLSGFYTTAQYRIVDPQPSQLLLRSEAHWVAWCERQAEKVT